MEEYDLLSIVWHEESHVIDLAYALAEPQSVPGTRDMAEEMAAEVGLELVSSSDSTVLWARKVETTATRSCGEHMTGPTPGEVVGRYTQDGKGANPWGWPANSAWILGLVLCGLVAAADAVLGRHVILIGLLIVGPCCAVFTGRWSRVAFAGAWAVGLAVVLGVPDGIWASGTQFVFLGVVVAVTVISTAATAIVGGMATRR